MIKSRMTKVANHIFPRQSRFRGIAFALSEIPLLIAFGALALLVIASVRAGRPIFEPNDLRTAFFFAMTFGVLSGYFFSSVLLVALYSYRLSWMMRTVTSVILFLVHVAVFLILVGDGSLSGADLGLVALGVISVVLADATASLLWWQFAISSRMAS